MHFSTKSDGLNNVIGDKPIDGYTSVSLE
jgi:hypothetical protein